MDKIANCHRYAPAPQLAPSKWSESNIQIPLGNALPGPISFRDAVYQRGIIDAVEDPRIRRISLHAGGAVRQNDAGVVFARLLRTTQAPFSKILMQPTPDRSQNVVRDEV